MKKLLWMMGLFVLVNGSLTSCSNDDSDEPGIIPETTIETSKGTYTGAENNMGKFKITLNSTDTEFQLNFISDLVAAKDLLEADLKSDKYIVSSTTKPYSISTDSYLTKANVEVKIVGGELTVNRSEDNYTIKGTLIDEQNKSHKISYTGLIDIEPVYTTVYEKQNGWYWGDNEFDYPNVGEYLNYFVQGKTDNYGDLNGDGYAIAITFFDAMAPKAWEAKVPNKTYSAASEYKVGTFLIATQKDIDEGASYYSFASIHYINEKEGIDKETFISGGSVKVMDHKDGQEVRFNLELKDGTRHVGKYIGKVKQGDQFTVTTLRADRQVGQLDYGYLEYKGKSPIAGKENNRWNIYLFNNKLTTYPEYYWMTEGSGEFLRVTLFTETNVTGDIKTGEFPIGEEKAGNAGSGGGSEAGLDFRTWFFELKNDNYENYAPIKTGKVTVAKTGKIYTITVDGVDDRQNKVKASYTGELTFTNHANKNTEPLQKGKNNGGMFNWKKNFKTTNQFKAYLGK